MKVLQLVEAACGGVGRHVIDLTEGLLSRGHEIHLVYSDLRSNSLFGEDLSKLGAHPGFREYRIRMQRAPHPLVDALAIRSLRVYVENHGPFELIHCHSTKAGLIGRLCPLARPVKRLYSPHMFFSIGSTGGRFARCIVGNVEAVLSKLCDGIIAVSREEYQHALELGISPARLCLIPNGVKRDSRPFVRDRGALRRDWRISGSQVCIGFVGRLVRQKSPETMLRSFAQLLGRSRATAKLVMVGDGPLAQPCRRLAAALDIEPHVIWVGDQDARTLMHAFDLLALTSDAEGHPIVVLEALTFGLPIVATSVGGIAETVRDGVNGFTVPTRGVAEIADALSKLVDDAALRARMGRASREISLQFSVDRMVDKTVAFYQQILSGRSSKPQEAAVAPEANTEEVQCG